MNACECRLTAAGVKLVRTLTGFSIEEPYIGSVFGANEKLALQDAATYVAVMMGEALTAQRIPDLRVRAALMDADYISCVLMGESADHG